MVGPTWMSLICTIVKPCNAAGRSAIGTSTATTAAVRRALTKPHAVTSSASSGTAIAVAAATPAHEASHATSSTGSRSNVSTKSDENRPIASEPAHASRSASGWRRTAHANRPIGISAAETTTIAMNHAAHRPCRSEPMRRPT